MRYAVFFLFIIIAVSAFGQQEVKRTVVDKASSYKLTVPDWLNVRETGVKTAWGGTTPAIDGVENAILIKSYSKSGYADIKDFENYIVGSWIFGKPTNWDSAHVCYGKKELAPYPNLGKAYRVSVMYQNKLYTCQYVLAETKTAFLWIDLTSTPALYDVNVKKFGEFLANVQLL